MPYAEDFKKGSNTNINNNFDDDTNMSSKGGKPDNGKQNSGCCKRVSKFLFSHIGLVAMVVVYSVAGSFLFQLLEQHEEAKMCQEGKGQESTNIVNLKSTLLTYIQFNISTNPADTSKDNETVANSKIETWLQEYRDQVNEVSDNYGYTGQDCSTTKWNFAGSLLFAITVITTIGYGNIAPKTWEGQIVCICYATIGIPLFLMCIANISGILGDMFRFLYSRVCCRLCMKKKKPSKQQDLPTQSGEFVGNYAKGGKNAKVDPNEPNIIGIEPVSQWANGANPKMAGYANKPNAAKVIDDNQDFDDGLKNDEEDEKVTVPLTITMIIITLYIVIGAVIFNLFEGWSLIEAGYFCFITLSTIGFGDFVPGQNNEDQFAAAKLLLAAIYVLFGMAIIAMCFDLMQEEIIAKFTWLGKKLGIIEKDEEDEAEEILDKEKKNAAQKEKVNGKSKENDAADNIEKPNYVSSPTHKNNETPAPDYRSNYEESMGSNASFRSPYLQNVVQRQQNKA